MARRSSLAWLVLLSALACAAPVRAVVPPGLELRLNTSSLNYDDMRQAPLTFWDTSWRSSFTGGVTLEIPLRQRLAIQAGLRYVEQGNRVRFQDPSPPAFSA